MKSSSEFPYRGGVKPMREFADDALPAKLNNRPDLDALVYMLVPVFVIALILGLGGVAAWYYDQQATTTPASFQMSASSAHEVEWSDFCEAYRAKRAGLTSLGEAQFHASYFEGNNLVQIEGETDSQGGLLFDQTGDTNRFSIDFASPSFVHGVQGNRPHSLSALKSLAVVFGDPLLKALESPEEHSFTFAKEVRGGRSLYQVNVDRVDGRASYALTIDAQTLLLERCQINLADAPTMAVRFSEYQQQVGRPVPQRVLAQTTAGDTLLMRLSAQQLR